MSLTQLNLDEFCLTGRGNAHHWISACRERRRARRHVVRWTTATCANCGATTSFRQRRRRIRDEKPRGLRLATPVVSEAGGTMTG